MRRVRARIFGRVQGVFFRHNTKLLADELGICGWVKNLEDGSVEAVFEGEDEKVDKMIDWCHKGPPLAKVERVEILEEEFKDEFKDFKIVY